MSDALLLFATWLGAVLGFGLLALTQEKHRMLRPARHRGTSTLGARLAGWTLLAVAIVPAIWRDGVAFGLILWCMTLTISAITVVGLVYRMSAR